jgi:hypothetical protein
MRSSLFDQEIEIFVRFFPTAFLSKRGRDADLPTDISSKRDITHAFVWHADKSELLTIDDRSSSLVEIFATRLKGFNTALDAVRLFVTS